MEIFKIIKEIGEKKGNRGYEEIRKGDIVVFEANDEGFSVFKKRVIEGTVEAVQLDNENWEGKIVVMGEDEKRRILLKEDVIKLEETENE